MDRIKKSGVSSGFADKPGNTIPLGKRTSSGIFYNFEKRVSFLGNPVGYNSSFKKSLRCQ